MGNGRRYQVMPTEKNLLRVNIFHTPIPDAPKNKRDMEWKDGEMVLEWIQGVDKYLRSMERSFTGEQILRILTEENVPDRTKNYFLMYDQSQDQLTFIEDTQ
jgi:hypothetical protein